MSGNTEPPRSVTGSPERAPEPVRTLAGARPAGPAPLLALVLSSEDALFRDPFADFIPSSR